MYYQRIDMYLLTVHSVYFLATRGCPCHSPCHSPCTNMHRCCILHRTMLYPSHPRAPQGTRKAAYTGSPSPPAPLTTSLAFILLLSYSFVLARLIPRSSKLSLFPPPTIHLFFPLLLGITIRRIHFTGRKLTLHPTSRWSPNRKTRLHSDFNYWPLPLPTLLSPLSSPTGLR